MGGSTVVAVRNGRPLPRAVGPGVEDRRDPASPLPRAPTSTCLKFTQPLSGAKEMTLAKHHLDALIRTSCWLQPTAHRA